MFRSLPENIFWTGKIYKNRHEKPPKRIRVESAITIMSSPEYFQRTLPRFPSVRPAILFWKDLSFFEANEYAAYSQDYIQTKFHKFTPNLKMTFLVAPPADRLYSISAMRKDLFSSKAAILFHYIGFGFPPLEDGSIHAVDYRVNQFIKIPLRRLFEMISVPSLSIFDCSNAAEALLAFQRASTLMSRTMDISGKWFCVCATDIDEELPVDKNLPSDFLTSCIFTPLRTALICYMVQFYRTSHVPQINFPFDYFNDENSELMVKQTNTLNVIIESIAASGLDTETYTQLFQTDPIISAVFRGLLLCQYLLRPYQLHPQSYPALPDLSSHKLWTEVKVLLMSIVCKNPTNFLERSVSACKVLYESGGMPNMEQVSILVKQNELNIQLSEKKLSPFFHPLLSFIAIAILFRAVSFSLPT